ncbi:UNVERIFIED_CONTAM: Somatic embryogenesis receptor kinase [Sesamum calycinum]|uniref:Somatic embryogenesis receptor kinase n=1 Tax=Sesamum calycinum TaxID=2727403 RepID=A0AAW2KZ72_9LAMI
MAIKSSLDPENLLLSSWSVNATDPCNGSFEGIACNEYGQVVNISLQGKGLSGQIPTEIGQLKSLSGLYLHFNKLHGLVPKELANLTELSDLYLNVNNLSGDIPPEIGDMPNLQVVQLCYNNLTGNIPTQLGSLKKLNVLALQSNQLTGAIPASLGGLMMLTRLDLSFNHLFGSIPLKLAGLPMLKVLDIRNNTLSGNVPLALKRLDEGFQYENNTGLCGIGFPPLQICSASGKNSNKPEPFGPGTSHLPSKDIPESANVEQNRVKKSRKPQPAVVVGVLGLIVAFAVAGLFTFSWYRRQKQKIGSAFDSSDSRLSTDQSREVCRRSASPLISLEYSNGWDPLAKRQDVNSFSQEVLESHMFNLDEVESATQYFSDMNLLGKGSFLATYKGGRGECFLIYDFVPNGNLLQYLDLKEGKRNVLDWPIRKSIIRGIAKGIEYLHGNQKNKPTLVHRNISAEKGSAAMGYLAPEYTTTGRFTEKSDVYAFGMIIFQILSGKSRITQLNCHGAEISRFEDFIDANLAGKFNESEAARLGEVALLCTHESPNHRPDIGTVMQELNDIMSNS